MLAASHAMHATLALALALVFLVHPSAGNTPDFSTIPGCSRDVDDPVEEVSLLQTQSGTTLRTAARSRASSRAQTASTVKARTVAAQPEPTKVELRHTKTGDPARRLRDRSQPMSLLSSAIGPYESEDEAGRHRIQQHVEDLTPMSPYGFFLASGVIAVTVAMILVFWVCGAQPMNPDIDKHKGTLSGQSLPSGASTPQMDVPESMPQTKAQAHLEALARGDVDGANSFHIHIGTPQPSFDRDAGSVEDSTSARAARNFEEDMVLAAKLAQKLDEVEEVGIAEKKLGEELVAEKFDEGMTARQKAEEELATQKLEEEQAAQEMADEELFARKLEEERAARKRELEEERAAKQKVEEELAATELEKEMAANQKADKDLVAQKLEEVKAAKPQADDDLAAKELAEKSAAEKKADEELVARKLEEERTAKQHAEEELAAKELAEESAAKKKADEDLVARKLEEVMVTEEKTEDLAKEMVGGGGAVPAEPSTGNAEEPVEAAKKASGRQRGSKKPRQGGGTGKR